MLLCNVLRNHILKLLPGKHCGPHCNSLTAWALILVIGHFLSGSTMHGWRGQALLARPRCCRSVMTVFGLTSPAGHPLALDGGILLAA